MRIIAPEDPAQTESIMKKFVVGMARLATELILAGAFDDEVRVPMSDARERIDHRPKRPA